MELINKNVLVTGGAGFIGSHLVDALLKMKNKVIAYDNFDDFYSGKNRNIAHNFGKEGFHLIRGDILDFESLSSTIKNVDVVFHEAGQAGIRYCATRPVKAHRVNTEGTLNVLLACKKNGVKKVVAASSSSIFGIPKYMPIDEDHPTNPGSFYGATKLAGEKYCTAFHEMYGLDVTCLRYFSVYGPRGRPDQVIYAFTDKVFKGERLVIYGDGSQTRDFTYISDVVDLTIRALEVDESSGQVFNIGYGKEISIRDVASKVTSFLGKEGVEAAYSESIRGEFPRTLADPGKSERILGLRPKVDFEKGLKKFIEWYISHNQDK